MALTLTTTINTSVEELAITGTVSASIDPGYRFRLSGSDEIMEIVGFARIPTVRTWPVDRNRWLVHRGLLGTTRTTHTNGATVQAVVDEFVASTDEVAPGPVSDSGGTPSAHHTSHENGGSDEIDVTGLAGLPTQFNGGTVTTALAVQTADATNDFEALLTLASAAGAKTILFVDSAGDGSWRFMDGPGGNDGPIAFQWKRDSDGLTILDIKSSRFTVSGNGVPVINVEADSGALGFFNTASVLQPAAIANATDAGSAITQLNLALAALRALGLIAT